MKRSSDDVLQLFRGDIPDESPITTLVGLVSRDIDMLSSDTNTKLEDKLARCFIDAFDRLWGVEVEVDPLLPRVQLLYEIGDIANMVAASVGGNPEKVAAWFATPNPQLWGFPPSW